MRDNYLGHKARCGRSPKALARPGVCHGVPMPQGRRLPSQGTRAESIGRREARKPQALSMLCRV